jgi:hypothetical protein
MPELTIQPASTSREKKQFLNLPWEIQGRDPNWMPPLRQHQKEMVGYAKNPFYDDAESQTFLALSDGKPVGRIAAILNHAHNRYHKENRGFWGFFECIDDVEVAQGLFEQVRAWHAAKGVSMIRGPMNPSMNYELGLLIDGFQAPPMFMMTHNPPYYPRLVEAAGYRKVEDMYAFSGHIGMLNTLDPKMVFITEECKQRFDVKLRRLDRRRFAQDVRLFLDIYNQSLVGTWGFTPLSTSEVEHMSGTLKYLIVPEMTTIAEIDGRAVGAQFGLLDYNPRIKKSNGRLFPFGFIRLLWNRRKIKRVRLISTNVIPEYQKWGLGLVIAARIKPEVTAWGIEEGEFSWVLESNRLSYGTLKRSGLTISKTYRIYDSPGSTRGHG